MKYHGCLFGTGLFAKFVKTEENETDGHKCCSENAYPHEHTANTLSIEVYEEIGVDEGRGGGGDEDGGVELQNDGLNEQEDDIGKGEGNGSDGVIPLAFFALIEQKPVGYVHDGEHNMECKAADSPVCLRISSFCTGQHDVENKESEQNAQHTYKFQNGYCGNIAIGAFLCGLDKSGEHNGYAKEIADIGEVDVEVPANNIDVIKDAEAGNAANKTEGAVKGLIN